MKTKILKHRVPKRILIGMLLVLFCFTSKAQTWENVHFNVDWQMNVPLNYNPQIQISAESETKRSIFREKDKTKRSKKESAQHSKSRNKSFVMTSVSAL